MKLSGWIFMLVSWGLIIGLFVYCMARTLKSKDKDETDISKPPDEN